VPCVLVHGVPETVAVWDPLRAHLRRDDVVALGLPGFGSPRPAGFSATKEEYAAWLTDELAALQSDGPIDLVGHDWGGGFVIRVVSTRPELVRSWVTDAAAIGDVNFEWHDFAKIWQTPGAGEEFFDAQLGISPEESGPLLASVGVPEDDAVTVAGWLDRTMADCILDLYRSAVDVGREWGPAFRDVAAPGLVVLPSDDGFLSAEGARAGAASAGAPVAELDGLGHWWMLQDPVRGASVLEDFWATLA